MIASAFAFWVFVVAWQGMQITILVLSGTLVAFAVFGLLTGVGVRTHGQYANPRMA